MIWSSRIGKLGVVLASVGAHGLAAFMFWGDPEVRIEGGAETAVQARLGNSFADMAAGTLAPETPDTLKGVEPTEVTETITPDTPIEAIESVPTRQTDPELKEAENRNEQQIAPAFPNEATPSRADYAAPSVVEPRVIEAVQPQQTVIAASPPPETLQALPEAGVQVSPRPPLRPQRIEREAEQRRVQKQQQRQQQPTRRVQQGNARQNTIAGSETVSNQAATTRRSTNTGRNSAAGNAAVSNYPGRVMRCISRAGRPRVGSRGTAVVAFSIAGNGRIGQVRLARSSGNTRLDRAAIQIISRAGPCPAPPQGAQRSYQISIKGRG